jgi:NAD(P)-dependent dehydrogenase (short-subunit alcohol dehydrogenase family)
VRELKGRNAFVAGAASGIGLGICRALANAGVNIALADIEQEPLDKAVAEIAALGVRAFGVRFVPATRPASACGRRSWITSSSSLPIRKPALG